MHPNGVSADAGDVGPEGPFRPGEPSTEGGDSDNDATRAGSSVCGSVRGRGHVRPVARRRPRAYAPMRPIRAAGDIACLIMLALPRARTTAARWKNSRFARWVFHPVPPSAISFLSSAFQ